MTSNSGLVTGAYSLPVTPQGIPETNKKLVTGPHVGVHNIQKSAAACYFSIIEV